MGNTLLFFEIFNLLLFLILCNFYKGAFWYIFYNLLNFEKTQYNAIPKPIIRHEEMLQVNEFRASIEETTEITSSPFHKVKNEFSK